MNPFSSQDRSVVLAARLLSGALVCALLYWGRAVLMPLALAALVGFMLHPVVVRLRRFGVPKLLSVGAAMLLGTGFIVSAMWFIAVQVASFTNELPTYQKNISEKVGQVQAAMRGGALDRLERMFEKIKKEAEERSDRQESVTASTVKTESAPVPVVIQSPKQWIDLSLVNSALPLLDPLVTGGLIFILVALMLLRWEDLRSRLVSVMNQNITRTTRAIDDAGKRITKYLAMQFLINGSYGLAVGVGLWFLGVPYAGLWGLCAGLFRYVPYAGPVAATALPLLVSLVTTSGWTQVAGVAALFLTLELISNNVIEPWLYGWRIGLSELGVIIAAVAWTFLWGTAGLVLAVPLTVCLVVLGEHVPALSFFSRLLGDKSALPLHLRLYQRLLAHDRQEASDLAREHAQANGFASTSDEIVAPALAHAREEEISGALSDADIQGIAGAIPFVMDRAQEFVESPDEEAGEEEDGEERPPHDMMPGLVVAWPLCKLSEALVPLLHHQCAELPCRWQDVPENSLSSEVLSKLAAAEEPPVAVCLVCLSCEDLPRVRSLCKKLRHSRLKCCVIVACWTDEKGGSEMENALMEAGATNVSWTPSETRNALGPHVLDKARHAGSAPVPARDSAADDFVPDTALPAI